MNTLSKTLVSAAVALSLLGSGLAATTAQAKNHHSGFGFGFSFGEHNGCGYDGCGGYYPQPVYSPYGCYSGPTQVRYVQVCHTDYYGHYFCHTAPQYYSPRICG